MKVMVAIDSFKGSVPSNELSDAVERGILSVYKDATVIKVPIADGGEGTVQTLIGSLGGEMVDVNTYDPLGRPIVATYGILNNTAVIEMASCVGLPLLEEHERNPLKTSTYGVGELIKDAINKGCREFILGLGGSATNDAGLGLLQSLGYVFFDQMNIPLPGVGESLRYVYRIDDTNRLALLDQCSFTILCDVDNPFCGPQGAAYVFAPQKGASLEMVKILDQGLEHFASVIKQSLNIDMVNLKGAGAAGGLGGGLVAFLNTTLKPGIELLFEMLDIENVAREVDLLITGEGRIDGQSTMGKVPLGVINLGKKLNIPVIGICGSIIDEAYSLHDLGLTALFSILLEPMSLNEAIEPSGTKKRVEQITSEIFRLYDAIKSK